MSRPTINLTALGVQEKPAKTVSSPAAEAVATRRGGKDSAWPDSDYGPASGMYDPKKGTSFIRGGIDPKRIDPISRHEGMHQMFHDVQKVHGRKAYKNLMGKLSREISPGVHAILDRFLSAAGYDHLPANHPTRHEEKVAYLHTFLTDPLNRERILHGLGPTERMVADKLFKRSYARVLRTASAIRPGDLFRKSVRGEDWNRLVRAHVPENEGIVDSSYHTSRAPRTPATFSAVVHHEKPIKTIKAPESGIAQKLVYEHPGGGAGQFAPGQAAPTVMVKPYHKKLESHTKGYVNAPITGWATLATKRLFDAGGIGHLAENVHAAEHGGIPVTVHEFANDHEPIYMYNPKTGGPQANLNPVSVGQVGLMDYLTNNSDRHGANLLVSRTHPDEEGYDKLLAIDHERNFQYNMHPGQVRPQHDFYGHRKPVFRHDHPEHYVSESAPGANAAVGAIRGIDHGTGDDLARWWKEASPKIKSSMENELGAIKDESVREHVRRNFSARTDRLDEWANQDNPGSPFSRKEGGVKETPISQMPDKNLEAVNAVMSRVKGDPYENARQLLAIDAANRYAGQKKAVMQGVLNKLVSAMSPEQAVTFFDMNHGHRNLSVRHALRSREVAPAERGRFAQAARKVDPRKKRYPAMHRWYAETAKG